MVFWLILADSGNIPGTMASVDSATAGRAKA